MKNKTVVKQKRETWGTLPCLTLKDKDESDQRFKPFLMASILAVASFVQRS